MRSICSVPGSCALPRSPIRESAVDSIIHVPEFVLGRRGGRVWLTSISTAEEPPLPPILHAEPLQRVRSARAGAGDLDPEKWSRLVEQVAAMLTPIDTSAEVDAFADDPTLRKIVLARDEVVTTEEDIDVRAVLGALNRSYPSCWTFDIAGLIGSTPELLIGVENNRVTSRVLAGTYRVEKNPTEEMPAARKLLSAHKDSTEHAFAIASCSAVWVRSPRMSPSMSAPTCCLWPMSSIRPPMRRRASPRFRAHRPRRRRSGPPHCRRRRVPAGERGGARR